MTAEVESVLSGMLAVGI